MSPTLAGLCHMSIPFPVATHRSFWSEKILEEMREAAEPLHHILWEVSSHVVPKSVLLSTLSRIWCQDLNTRVYP